MPDQVAQIGKWLGLILPTIVCNRKIDLQLSQGRLWFHLQQHGQSTGGKQGSRDLLRLVVAVGYRRKHGRDQLLQFVERLGTQYHQSHGIGRVVFLVEGQQFVTDARPRSIGQRLQATDRELAEGVLRVHALLQHIQTPATVAFQPHLEFSLNRVLLTVHILGIEARCNKELGETIQGLRQMIGADIKEIIGVLEAGVGVA